MVCSRHRHPLRGFVYRPDWSAEHAADFLRGCQGFVHGDGYAGYAASLEPPSHEELVVAHNRRSRQPANEDLSADERLERRRELSLPVLDELLARTEDLHPSSFRARPCTGRRRTHGINASIRTLLTVEDGRLEVDNGEAERQIRPLKLGKKNYLFVLGDRWTHDVASGTSGEQRPHLERLRRKGKLGPDRCIVA